MAKEGKTISQQRGYYYKKIKQYEVRRNEYRKYLRSVSVKIAIWRKEVRNIDKKTEAADWLGKLVKEYTGVSVRNIKNSKSLKLTRAKQFFYKYGLEMGLSGPYLHNYTGVKDGTVALNHRKSIGALMKKNPEIKQDWDSFKLFVNDSK